jgi:hypothetical protein
LWLRSAAELFDVAQNPWLCNIVQTYSAWTAVANGAELGEGEDLDNPPREWNDIYFRLLALCMPAFTALQVDELVLAPIVTFPEEVFFDTVASFMQSVDLAFFGNKGLQKEKAVNVRATLARHMMTTRGWQRLNWGRSNSIERHIAPAIASLFFNNYNSITAARCYLNPKGIDDIQPFVPTLNTMLEAGPYTFVALVALNLFEVSPRAIHLPSITKAAKAWLKNYPKDTTFWIDHIVGRRLCALLTAIMDLQPALFKPAQETRHDIDYILAELVRMGVAEASTLERVLAQAA